MPVLCFHRHSRIARAKKEFFFRGSAPEGQPTRRGWTVYKCPPNFRTQHQPPKRPSLPIIFPALPYATGVADCWGFVKCKLYDVHGSVKVRAVGARQNRRRDPIHAGYGSAVCCAESFWLSGEVRLMSPPGSGWKAEPSSLSRGLEGGSATERQSLSASVN